MLFGYPNDDEWNCYRMYNLFTSRTRTTSDISWLGRMHYKYVRFHTTEDLSVPKSKKSIVMKDMI